MPSQWDSLAEVFGTDLNPSAEGYAADNILIAWPSLLRGIEQTFGSNQSLNVLDFGCGGGLFCNQLAGKGHHVTGYDDSASMLAAARTRAQAGVKIVNHPKVALKPKAYDVITTCMVMPFIADLRAMTAAFINALKPNGLIIQATFNPAFIAENKNHAFFPPAEQNDLSQIELKPGVKIPFYQRSAADYQKTFASYQYEEVYRDLPPFTSGFLDSYPMPFATKEPEYLVQGFQAKNQSKGQ